MKITVGARNSPLSKAQVSEVQTALQKFFPMIELIPYYVETMGDKDKITSLRTKDKSDFFTREIDLLQKEGIIRMAIHSAKDLPDPLPNYLQLAALTACIDPSDSLVLRTGESFEQLPEGARIGTSSLAREERIRQMRQDLTFVDLRGTIEERLLKLEKKEVDGIVMAEAAILRLRLTHLNRRRLEGRTTPGQGQLACLVKKGDQALISLLSVLDFGSNR